MDLMPRLSSNGAKRSANGASPDAPPRYAAIKQSIYDAIGDGRLKPGDRVPSEADLVEQFDVSRMTANRALRELQSARSEEHTSELQSLMRISYAVFCLKKKNKKATRVHNKKHKTRTATVVAKRQISLNKKAT